MRVRIADGKCTLKPATDAEHAALSLWTQRLKPGDRIYYRGRGPDDGEFWTVKIEAADVTLHLVGNVEEDKYAIQDVRNALFFSGAGPLYLGAEGAVVTIAGGLCKHCKAPVTDMASCEWATCDRCVSSCQHVPVRGITHSPTKEIGAGWFCDKCGRGAGRSIDVTETTCDHAPPG